MADEVSRTNPTHGLTLQVEIRQLRRDLLDLGNEQGVSEFLNNFTSRPAFNNLSLRRPL